MLRAARRERVTIEDVETNAPWHQDPDDAAELLGEINALDDSVPHSLHQYESHHGRGYLNRLYHRYRPIHGGRVYSTFRSQMQHLPLAEILKDGTNPCTHLTNPEHFHLDLNGDCDLCLELRTWLALRTEEPPPDLRPREFYTVDLQAFF